MNKHITQTALLGTSKRMLDLDAFPASLTESIQMLQSKGGDPEDIFYRATALALTYERAGVETCYKIAERGVATAGIESKPYPAPEVKALATTLIGVGRVFRLHVYRRLIEHGYILGPEQLAQLIDLDREHYRANERLLLRYLGGERLQFILQTLTQEEEHKDPDQTLWETGTIAERKQVLRSRRKINPQEAREMLIESFKSNTAQHREDLLSCLSEGLSLEDEAFLSEVMNSDRGTGVKKKARELLLSLEDSALIRRLGEILSEGLHYEAKVDSNRGLLGRIANKISNTLKKAEDWTYTPIEYSDELKNLGFMPVSSVKGEDDNMYLLRQIAECMPLSWWSKLTGLSKAETVNLLTTHAPFPIEYFNFESAVLNFKDSEWIKLLFKSSYKPKQIEAFIGLLPTAEREQIRIGITETYWAVPQEWFGEQYEPWGEHFSMEVIKTIINVNHGYYSEAQWQELALVLHPSVCKHLEHYFASTEANEGGSSYENQYLMELARYISMVAEFDKALRAKK